MNQPLPEAFAFCPKCGTAAGSIGNNPFECTACGFRFFFGPTAAVAAIVTDQEDRVLFLKRARDPGRGLLGLPGGFVDAGESVEEAMIREVLEETNLKVASFSYIGSYPNTYAYRGLLYSVSDVFFRCYVDSFDSLKTDPSEVEESYFLHPTTNELSRLAFPSNRRAVEKFLEPR
jgi:NADH pyrophosphatase NudC (nudix superfamily)